jgi:hypothetical protein
MVKYPQSHRATVFFRSKPNDYPISFSIYFAHTKNLSRSLNRVILIDTNCSDPEETTRLYEAGFEFLLIVILIT